MREIPVPDLPSFRCALRIATFQFQHPASLKCWLPHTLQLSAVKKRRNPVCPFCQTRNAPPSREDIFARWIARLWPTSGHFKIDTIRDGHIERTYGARGNLGFVLTKPCEKCNNGWMSALEQSAIPVLTPMIQGQPAALTYANCRTLTQWIVKTGIMFEFYQNRTKRYFARRDRTGLREALEIPRIRVFLARYVCRSEPNSFWFHDYLVPLVMTTPEGTVNADAYTATFAIGQMVIQFFAHRCELGNVLHIPGNWDDACVQVWPNHLGDEEWRPPSLVLDEENLSDFSWRWAKLMAHS